MTLYVEGGGSGALRAEGRKGFKAFLRSAGVRPEPSIVACGTRRHAYEQFCKAVREGKPAMLLVDSEVPVAPEHQAGPREQWHPWRHLKARPGDGWDPPVGAGDRHCHLMVECMESWFVADADALTAYFGQGFAPNALPKRRDVEAIPKRAVYGALAKATAACKTKSPYSKGNHSFAILARVDPARVAAASPWAERFIAALRASSGHPDGADP